MLLVEDVRLHDAKMLTITVASDGRVEALFELGCAAALSPHDVRS